MFGEGVGEGGGVTAEDLCSGAETILSVSRGERVNRMDSHRPFTPWAENS